MKGGRRCVVLGAHGFVGSAVAAEAARRGFELLAVDKDNYDAARGATSELLINANGNSRKYLATQDPALEFDLSVRSVQRSLHEFRCAQYVHLSSCDVYPDPSSPATTAEDSPIESSRLSQYGFHKWLAEQIVRHDARRWLILRMGGFVGPRLWKNSIYDLLTGAPLRVDLASAYQYLDTRDFARILFDLIERGVEERVINVAGEGIVTLREVAEWLGRDAPAHVGGMLPVERYEISLDTLRRYCPPPSTRESVRRFLDECRRTGGIPR
ncbi:MAG: NAD(P)-dependent oxidoreductase [Kiritimatiellae bacterium]|nr:NAD(P)-dependent oxidoreductase [Kiritimatiellia bacterium]